MDAKIIIFSLPRSGSTTLASILECDPGIRFAYEPFNPGQMRRRNCAEGLRDEASIGAALDGIWRTYDGIKHVWDHGIDLPECRLVDRYLLVQPRTKVIFLNRRNILRRLVSVAISTQTGSWSFTTAARERLRTAALQALDVGAINFELQKERAAIADYRTLLADSRREFIEWWYEDLFADGRSLDEQLQKLTELFSFLGLASFDVRTSPNVRSLLNPLNGRLNSTETYARIPNASEVERQLGSDETGWLFA